MAKFNLETSAANSYSELPEPPDLTTRQLSPFVPKNLDGPHRVIKKMMFIDPEKLQKAGLDKKIAEALNKTKGSKGNLKKLYVFYVFK